VSSLIVKAENLKKTYKLFAEEIAAVNGVNLEISEGEFVSIMGPSGSGKTTLLDMIGCLDSITGGRLDILGTNVSKMSERNLVNVRKKKIGFIFQDFSLIHSLTAFENIQLPLYFSGIQKTAQEIISLLERVGLEHRINHLPKQMSGGEQQRIAIARALSIDPEFLIADEPTGHLDTENSLEILNYFKKLNKEGLTIIMATHDTRLGSQTTRTVYMEDGKVV